MDVCRAYQLPNPLQEDGMAILDDKEGSQLIVNIIEAMIADALRLLKSVTFLIGQSQNNK